MRIRVIPSVVRTVLVVPLMALVVSMSSAQVVFKSPQPGQVYKEYIRWIDNYSNDWRVTDPSISLTTFPQAAPFLPNPTVYFTVDDLTDAIKAEAVITLWGGHVGTTNKTIAFNGNAPISIPELGAINGIPAGNGQCYQSEMMTGIDVPLAQLQVGSNYFRANSGGQSCYGFGWGQWGIYDLIIRVYYDPAKKAHATGTIASPSAGGTMGENPLVSASVSGSVNRVDFLAYYDGYDTDGDGIYQEYHHDYHNGKDEGSTSIRNHVGTATSAPWQVTWNTQWVPDQTPGSMKMLARIRDNNGVWYVTPEVTNLSLTRSGYSIKLYKPEGVPEEFWVQGFAGSTKSCRFTIPGGDNLASATDALMHLRTWNGNNEKFANEPGKNGHYVNVNSYTVPEASYGVGHFYSYDKINIPTNAFTSGTNTVEFFANTEAEHGIEIAWPGPAVMVRYTVSTTPSIPSITSDPSTQTVTVGQTATFTVAASGNPAPSYQWQKNNADITGATSTSYTTPATAKADSGATFRCIVTNSVGADTSASALLKVLTAPLIVNILSNGSFESGTTSWFFFTNGVGALSTVTPGTDGASAGRISITTAGTNVQLQQTSFPLEANTKYTLKFDAYASTSRTITASLFQNVSPYTNYGLNSQPFTLGTSWQTFSVTFTTSGISGTVTDTRLMLWFANANAAGDQYYFDNIILGKGDGTPSVPPTINVWYGSDQTFGRIGIPQRWVNIVGNVSAPNVLDSLFYTLNGGPRIALTAGMDSRRLAATGDFNIDLAYSQLLGPSTPNSVVITAKDKLGKSVSTTVTVHKSAAAIWPIPYTVSWSTPASLADSSQVVDGKWAVSGGSLNIVDRGYDRLVAIGDTTLTDYEATVRVTINGIDSSANAFSDINAGPGVGFIFRWKGHTDDPFTGQPKPGYLPLGSIGWVRWLSVSSQRWELLGNDVVTKASSLSPIVQFGVPFYLKMRVETIAGQGGLYQLRVWKATDPEPTTWLLSSQETLGDPQQGSLLLVAHNATVSFGPVSIIHVNERPAITQEPASRNVQAGQTATFTVSVVGMTPLSYQWQKNGTAIQGAVGSSYTTPPATQADNGSTFRCIVSNAAGSDTSVVATLTVGTNASIACVTGWNLISVPLLAPSMAVGAIFPSAVSTAYQYESGAYTSATTLANTRGYWLKFAAPVSQPVAGAVVASRDVAVAQGWNIVGPLESDVPLASITTTPAGIVASQFWGYTDGGYAEATTLHMGQGYWVKTSLAGVLHLPSGTAKAGESLALLQVEPTWPRLYIEDSKGRATDLFLAPPGEAIAKVELPPLPPAGVFDIRFGSGMKVETSGKGTYELALQGVDPPIAIRASNLGGGTMELRDAITGELFRVKLHDGETVTLTQKLERLLLVNSGSPEVPPTNFAIIQNYPNPFNPTTNIRFDLPEPSRVTLKVYSMLGQEVATLAEGSWGAGSYSVVWNGKNSSGTPMGSGVYVYRIVAVGASGKDFASTKRMVLVK